MKTANLFLQAALVVTLTFFFTAGAKAQSFESTEDSSNVQLLLLRAPSSLHDTMKAMGKLLKAITSQVDDVRSNASSAKMADQLVALTLHAKHFTPDHADSSVKARYDQALDHLAATERLLAKAFRANDNAKAKKLIDAINAEKKAGHGAFD